MSVWRDPNLHFDIMKQIKGIPGIHNDLWGLSPLVSTKSVDIT